MTATAFEYGVNHGYDIYAGNWPVTDDVPPLPLGAHKATEGLGTHDPRFAEWVARIAPRHRWRGAYHVLWPWRDATGKGPDEYIDAQAADFLAVTEAAGVQWDRPGWLVQIDNEAFRYMPRAANVGEVRRFADYLIARIGPRVLHYCNPVTDPELFFAGELADLPKWEAQFNRGPSRPATLIRQFGGQVVDGLANGVPVDANYCHDFDRLDQLTGRVPYQPTESEDDMPTLYVTDGEAVIASNDPGVWRHLTGADFYGVRGKTLDDPDVFHADPDQWAELAGASPFATPDATPESGPTDLATTPGQWPH